VPARAPRSNNDLRDGRFCAPQGAGSGGSRTVLERASTGAEGKFECLVCPMRERRNFTKQGGHLLGKSQPEKSQPTKAKSRKKKWVKKREASRPRFFGKRDT